jgi:hypothetical protein
MTSGIRAIETQYKGYRFRSRSEARWALFMDEAGVEWTYEDEGYELDGVRYLPDFYLPKQDCWLEVKGARPEARSTDAEKTRRLAEASGKAVYVISGEIGPDYVIEVFGPGRFLKYRWCICIRCKKAGIAMNGNAARLPCLCFRDDEIYVSDNWTKIREALLKARQERFGT